MKITIAPDVYAKIMFFVQESPIEISGMGRAIRIGPEHFYITKAYLLSQENTAASTDIDAEAMADCLYETREDDGELLFWWHSHVNMGAFWSGTDMKCFEDIGGNGMLIGTVFNKRAEMKTALYRAGDSFFPAVFMNDIKTEIGTPITTTQAEAWRAEMKAKCRVKTYTQSKVTGIGGMLPMDDYAGLTDNVGGQRPLWDQDDAILLKAEFISIIDSAKAYTNLSSMEQVCIKDVVDLVYSGASMKYDVKNYYEECLEPMMRAYHMMDLEAAIKELPETWQEEIPPYKAPPAKKTNLGKFRGEEKKRRTCQKRSKKNKSNFGVV